MQGNSFECCWCWRQTAQNPSPDSCQALGKLEFSEPACLVGVTAMLTVASLEGFVNISKDLLKHLGTELLQEGGPFQGPKLGSCLTLRNELSEETHADKARDFIGKGQPGGEQ